MSHYLSRPALGIAFKGGRRIMICDDMAHGAVATTFQASLVGVNPKNKEDRSCSLKLPIRRMVLTVSGSKSVTVGRIENALSPVHWARFPRGCDIGFIEHTLIDDDLSSIATFIAGLDDQHKKSKAFALYFLLNNYFSPQGCVSQAYHRLLPQVRFHVRQQAPFPAVHRCHITDGRVGFRSGIEVRVRSV